MIIYDWKKLYTETGKDPSQLLNLIAFLTYPRIPDNKYDPIYNWAQKDWSGMSFLLNPERLLGQRANFKDLELAEYVALASFRSYADYLTTNRKTLAMELSPVDLEFIKRNRLLTYSEDEIFFCWEEVTH